MSVPADVLSAVDTIVSFALGVMIVYIVNRLKLIYELEGKRALWLVVIVSAAFGVAQSLAGEVSIGQPFFPAFLKALPSILASAMAWYRLVVRE